MFHVLGLFGFNHGNNSNQVKKVCLWSNPRLPFGAFRRKGNRKLRSVLGLVEWSLRTSSSTKEVAQFQQELEKQ